MQAPFRAMLLHQAFSAAAHVALIGGDGGMTPVVSAPYPLSGALPVAGTEPCVAQGHKYSSAKPLRACIRSEFTAIQPERPQSAADAPRARASGADGRAARARGRARIEEYATNVGATTCRVDLSFGIRFRDGELGRDVEIQ